MAELIRYPLVVDDVQFADSVPGPGPGPGPTPVPEPSIIALFAAGLFGIGFGRRRKHI